MWATGSRINVQIADTMVKTKAKGNRIRLIAKHYYESLGYLVEITEKAQKFVEGDRDLFGVADLMAIKKGEPKILIQCTTLKNIHTHLTYCAWALANCDEHLRLFQYVHVDRKGARIFEYYPDGNYKKILEEE